MITFQGLFSTERKRGGKEEKSVALDESRSGQDLGGVGNHNQNTLGDKDLFSTNKKKEFILPYGSESPVHCSKEGMVRV